MYIYFIQETYSYIATICNLKGLGRHPVFLSRLSKNLNLPGALIVGYVFIIVKHWNIQLMTIDVPGEV